MTVMEMITNLLNDMSQVELDAPTRDGRMVQLAEYRCAYNLLMDAAGPMSPTTEYFGAKARASTHLMELDKYFDSYECFRMACDAIGRATKLSR
jgi:hypothetical protein